MGGIGGKVDKPPNWSGNRAVPNWKEYTKFNCTTLKAFEIRLSQKGWPNRIYIRCRRVAWHMEQGWYSSNYIDMLEDLDKWPPPAKYKHGDWLAWSQADREVNKIINEYCQVMKRQLKETITAATASEFRQSADPLD